MKLKKTSILVLASLLIAAIITAGWWFYPKQLKHIQADDVSRIVTFNGNTGKLSEISDSAHIEKIVNSLNNVKLNKNRLNWPSRTGFSYIVEIYQKNGNLLDKFTMSNEYITFNAIIYKAQNSFDTTILESPSIDVNTELLSHIGKPFKYFSEKYGWKLADLEPSLYEGPPVGYYTYNDIEYVFNNMVDYEALTEEKLIDIFGKVSTDEYISVS